MSPSRSLIRRRRSSLAALAVIKAGNYGVSLSSSPRALTFAPNVTPGTYVEADDDVNDGCTEPLPPTTLFPPTEPNPAPTRRRLPPGKRLSQGYIPRPPNAFMLFRANFVRQKHVPGSIETNHGSLSKIIGNCWRSLPLEEKKVWEIAAKKAKAAHREQWPNYRFRPVHNKNKKKGDAASKTSGTPTPVDKRKDKLAPAPGEEERCEVVAQLLLEGKKGEELAEAMRQIDLARARSRPESAEVPHVQPDLFSHRPSQFYIQRRPSSVPPPTTLYNAANIALPTLPFLVAPTPQPAYDPNSLFNGYALGTTSVHTSRAPSPVGNIARAYLAPRRASSCQPIPSERMWDGYDPHSNHAAYGQPEPMPMQWQLQPDWEPLPEVTDTSIFQPGWTNSFKDAATPESGAYDPHMQMQAYHLAPDATAPGAPLHLNIGPLDSFDYASTPSTATDTYSAVTPDTGALFEPMDPHAPWPMPESGPSSAFSGSPAHSDASLPPYHGVHSHAPSQLQSSVMCAPQPQHPQMQFDAWSASNEQEDVKFHHMQPQVPMHAVSVEEQHQQYMSALPDESYASQYEMYGDVGMGMDMDMSLAPTEYAYCPPQEY